MGEERPNALKGKRVVVTRAVEQNQTLVHALHVMGAEAVLMPMVAFGPPDDVTVVDEAIRGTGGYDWLLLTSQNALRAVQERCEVLGIGLVQTLGKMQIAAVGPATAEAGKHAGLDIQYVATTHHGAALAEELGEKVRGKRILLPRSDRANPELVKRLESLGAEVKEIVAYKTVRPDEGSLDKAGELVREGADAVLFFSPSAVHHLEDVLGNAKFLEFSRRALFAAIGPVTEGALRRAKVERLVMAKDTTVDAIIAALRDYFQASTKLPAGAEPE